MLNKPATVSQPIQELLQVRWSPRAFSPQVIEKDVLISLLEAARWAPSCFNEQPWRFMVASKAESEAFAHLLSCLMEGNQVWAKQASVLMISIAKMTFGHNGESNRHAFHDVGLAVGNLVFEATARGIGVHQMGGIHLDKIKELYEIPEDYEPVAGLALGYFGDPESLPEPLRTRELAARSRKGLSEIVFEGLWEQAARLVG